MAAARAEARLQSVGNDGYPHETEACAAAFLIVDEADVLRDEGEATRAAVAQAIAVLHDALHGA